MYSYYLFDFDYTLVDSSEGIVGCFTRTLEQLGRPPVPADNITRTIGLPMPVAVGQILGTDDDAVISDFINRYKVFADEYMTPGTHFFPSTLKTLSALHAAGKHIAIISSKTSSRIQEKFDRDGGAELIDFIIGNLEIKKLKPDPEGILLALSRFGAEKSEAIYVGDNIVDAQAAQNAGIDFAGVTTGTTKKEQLSSYPHISIMDDLSMLLKL